MSWLYLVARDKDTNILVFEKNVDLMAQDSPKSDDIKAIIGDGKAQVGFDITLTGPVDDRWLKITAVVRLTCNQDEVTLEQAAELALLKSNEFVIGGVRLISDAMREQKKADGGA